MNTSSSGRLSSTPAPRAALIGVDKADMDQPIWQQASKGVAAELNLSGREHHHVRDPLAQRIHADQCGRPKPPSSPRGSVSAPGFSNLNVNRDNIDPSTHPWTQAPNLSAASDKEPALARNIPRWVSG